MDIISDMTRQFKSVEEDLTNKINSLEKRRANNDEELRGLEQTKQALLDEIKQNEVTK